MSERIDELEGHVNRIQKELTWLKRQITLYKEAEKIRNFQESVIKKNAKDED